MNIILSRQAKKFLLNLLPKHARQLGIKIIELKSNAYPNDSKMLKGTKAKYYRIDVGEFRIIYQLSKDEDAIQIFVIDKRNDKAAYKTLFNQLK